MSQVTFIILHYATAHDTERCVSSILARTVEPCDVVVVDNASANGSGRRLQSGYAGMPRIHVLLNESNLGFARGFNRGIQYARRQLNARFVVLLNNDVALESEGFDRALIARYRQTPFAVLGPDIRSTQTGQHQNPRRVFFKTPAGVRKNLRFLRVVRACSRLHAEKAFLSLHARLKEWLRAPPTATHPVAPARPSNPGYLAEDLMLYGACLALSPDYLERYPGLHSGTFCYLEEDILWFLCRRLGLALFYDPSMVVLHREQSATSTVFESQRTRELFRTRELVRSNKVLFRLMTGRETFSAGE